MRRGIIVAIAMIAVFSVIAVNVGYAYSGNMENSGNSMTHEYAHVYLYSDQEGEHPLTSPMTRNLTFNSVTVYVPPNHVTTYTSNSTLLADCYMKIAGSHVQPQYKVELRTTKALSDEFTYSAKLGNSTGTVTTEGPDAYRLITFTNVPASESGSISHLQVYASWNNSGVPGYAPPEDLTPIKFVLSAIYNDSVDLFRAVFDSNGGSEIQMQFIESGERISEPSSPTRAGYEFAGWYTDTDLTSAYDFDSEVDSDVTLYAKWESS